MNVPLLENPAIAIILSKDLKNERIIVGEKIKIKHHFIYGDLEDFIVDIKRPIGQFIKDFVPRVGFIADLIIELADGYYDKLEELYEDKNPIYKFLALRIWQEFNTNKNSYYEFTDDLRHNLFGDILKGQKEYKQNPFYSIQRLSRNNPVEVFYEYRDMREVGVTQNDLLPLAMWYMRKIYDKGYYLQECKICEKVFLAKTATIEVLCSDKCKKENARRLKAEFDERIKDIGYEQAYENEYGYWHYRVKKYPKNSPEWKALKEFSKKAKSLKKQVKQKEIPEQDFLSWLIKQRDIIDNLIGDVTANFSKSKKQRYSKGQLLKETLAAEYQNSFPEELQQWQKYADKLILKYTKGEMDYGELKFTLEMEEFINDSDFFDRR